MNDKQLKKHSLGIIRKGSSMRDSPQGFWAVRTILCRSQRRHFIAFPSHYSGVTVHSSCFSILMISPPYIAMAKYT
ncbi:hypothetical protein BDV27DRAFT_53123 [Aspergillus caelatus]|uniref:Uncharacterized protein n=1 Tax=Aspergillus caelatus TaxID=61420 RepID=A0A5N6ZPH9_9EURO|nr:uncharacterized protein BDV27DRAFT_53123 [Aspergillus caelatus]KAE8359527.1 hypothetical protein BDV27DRAFT_53123 [Aspergillus caelatus]